MPENPKAKTPPVVRTTSRRFYHFTEPGADGAVTECGTTVHPGRQSCSCGEMLIEAPGAPTAEDDPAAAE